MTSAFCSGSTRELVPFGKCRASVKKRQRCACCGMVSPSKTARPSGRLIIKLDSPRRPGNNQHGPANCGAARLVARARSAPAMTPAAGPDNKATRLSP